MVERVDALAAAHAAAAAGHRAPRCERYGDGRAGGRRCCCRACWSSPSRRPGASASARLTERGRAGGARRPRGGAGRAVLRARHRRGRGRDRARASRRSRALHFQLGGKLHLHWLRDRIALLARDTRWAAMARAALRDDLFSLHAELTRDVLRFESLDAWLEANRPAVERAQEILGEIRAGGDVRPDDAAGRAARGAQPDRAGVNRVASDHAVRTGTHASATRRPAARSATTGRARRRCC